MHICVVVEETETDESRYLWKNKEMRGEQM
jgi:hypothetical protein